jgi:H+/gluconate symporter-like permease
MWWLQRQSAIAKAAKEGYGDHIDNISVKSDKQLPGFITAITPIFLVIIINYLCVKVLLPELDTSYLALQKYGAVEIQSVASNWAIIIAVFFASLFLLIVHRQKLDITKSLNMGAADSLTPIFNTASVVGYGAVINNLIGFTIIKNWIFSVASGDPLISSAFVTGALGGITGSASGGLSISLEMLGAKYLAMAQTVGVEPEALHRIVALASAALNTLPHNGAVITLLAICGMTHKDSYKDIFVGTLAGPFIATVVCIIMYKAFGMF